MKCEKSKCHSTISKDFVEQQHWLAAHLATTVGGDGSSVLIFVAGMADIVSITEKIEQIFVPGLICKW